MPSVNFYLKKSNSATGKSLIYLQFKYHKKRLVFCFNETIEPTNWNAKKQRVKSSAALSKDGSHLVNDLLDNLQQVLMNTFNREKAKGIPLPETLRKSLIDYLQFNITQDDKQKGTPTFFDLLNRFCSGEIKYRGRDKSKSTLQNYCAARKHLVDFSKRESYPLTFETVNLDFFYRYTSFLAKKIKLSHNSISKDVSIIKGLMAEAVDLEYTTNMDFRKRKFSMPEIEVEACYLTDKEILALYHLDLSNLKSLERIRDLFVFGCYVGLRYSDYSNIKKENILHLEDGCYIKITTQKTKELVIIPLNPIVLEIFKKYSHNENGLPPKLSIQKFNDGLKVVAEKAGLTSTGRVLSQPDKKLYELLSSHCARRSFATNTYLQGFPILDIMRITGHKSMPCFLRYVKVSKLDTAKRLQTHITKNLSQYSLKAVG